MPSAQRGTSCQVAATASCPGTRRRRSRGATWPWICASEGIAVKWNLKDQAPESRPGMAPSAGAKFCWKIRSVALWRWRACLNEPERENNAFHVTDWIGPERPISSVQHPKTFTLNSTITPPTFQLVRSHFVNASEVVARPRFDYTVVDYHRPWRKPSTMTLTSSDEYKGHMWTDDPWSASMFTRQAHVYIYIYR